MFYHFFSIALFFDETVIDRSLFQEYSLTNRQHMEVGEPLQALKLLDLVVEEGEVFKVL